MRLRIKMFLASLLTAVGILAATVSPAMAFSEDRASACRHYSYNYSSTQYSQYHHDHWVGGLHYHHRVHYQLGSNGWYNYVDEHHVYCVS